MAEREKRTEIVTVRFTEAELGLLLWAVAQSGETASTFAWRSAVEKARALFAARIAVADVPVYDNESHDVGVCDCLACDNARLAEQSLKDQGLR